MSTKRKPSKSPKKSYRTFARSSCASPSVISAGANKKKRYSAQSPESGACILSSSDSSESPSGERESGGTPLKTVGTPTRLSPLNSAGYQSPSSDNGDAIHPNFAESNKSVIGRHGNAHLLPPGFPDSVAEQTAEFPQLAGQTSSQPLPGKEEKSKTFQNQPSTDSSEDFVLHKKARRSRKHRPRLRGSSDDDSPGKNPFATGRRHAFSSESSEDDVLTSKKPTMTPKRHPGWSDSSDSEENSGEAKGPPNQLRTGQKKKWTRSSSLEESSSEHLPSDDEGSGTNSPSRRRPLPTPGQNADQGQPPSMPRQGASGHRGALSSQLDPGEPQTPLFSRGSSTDSPLPEVVEQPPSPQFAFVDQNRDGVGMSFPTWSASDANPTPCSFSSDKDWLYLLSQHAEHIWERLSVPWEDMEVCLHSPVSRIRNNDASRVAAKSETTDFKPRTRYSSKPARHPLPLAGFPNLLVGTIRNRQGYLFTISVFILVEQIRQTNYTTNEEAAVLCLAMNAAKMLHSSLLPNIGGSRQMLDKATNALPPFRVGKTGDHRKETRFDGLSGYYFFLGVRRALELLVHNPHCFQGKGLVANVDGTAVEPVCVQQCAVMFLEKSIWEASCAGCKHVGRITEFYEINLSDKDKIREYVARSLALLQRKLENMFDLFSELPAATLAVDYAVVIETLLAGTSLVLDGIAAGRFAESLVGERSRRTNTGTQNQPPAVQHYFNDFSSWRSMEDAFPCDDWNLVPYYPRDDRPWETWAREVDQENFSSVRDWLEEFFRIRSPYQFDGRHGEPKIAYRWRVWTDSGCRGPVPIFMPDQMLWNNRLFPRPTLESWNTVPNPPELSDTEQGILDAYQGQFPFGIRGLRLMRNYSLSQHPHNPNYRGASHTSDQYRCWLWSPLDWSANHPGDRPPNTPDDDASTIVNEDISEEDVISQSEMEELEAAIVEEDVVIAQQAERAKADAMGVLQGTMDLRFFSLFLQKS